MPKKIRVPLVHFDKIDVYDGYDTPCDGLGILNDKDLKAWRLVHISSGSQIGSFRTRNVALRAADLHTMIDVDWTMPSEELRGLPDFLDIATASVAACAIAIAEDEAERVKKKSEAAKQDTEVS